MTQQHPITPPPELVQQWNNEAVEEWTEEHPARLDLFIAARAAQWGADQELEACCEWIKDYPWAKHVNRHLLIEVFCSARRPKPQSLKEQALELAKPAGTQGAYVTFGPEELGLIRRALEQLND